jgi:hypothetical protein
MPTYPPSNHCPIHLDLAHHAKRGLTWSHAIHAPEEGLKQVFGREVGILKRVGLPCPPAPGPILIAELPPKKNKE